MTPVIPQFLQLHYLHDYSGVLLNRDENGLSKRMMKGGLIRTRRSSQSIKRTIRKAAGPYALTNITPDSIRTRVLADTAILGHIRRHLPDADGESIEAALIALNIGLYDKQGQDIKKRQNLLFGQPEVEWLAQSTVACLRENPAPEDAAKAVAAMFNGTDAERNYGAFVESQVLTTGITGALNGRMVTADPRANIEGAVHVSHAYTIHAEQPELDFLTVIDDIREEQGGPGSASIFTTEINSGIFYLYIVIDIPLLTSNTTGCAIQDWLDADRTIAAEAAANYAALAALALSGAKLGSTAAHERAQVVLAELGSFHPRSLGGAYTIPAQPNIPDGLLKLNQHLGEMDRMYGKHEARRLLAPGGDINLEQLHAWIRTSIEEGQAS